MSKQPKLFDIPKTHPTGQERLNAFKEQHGILTHKSGQSTEEWDNWMAVLPFDDDKGKSIGEIIGDSGRLYDESGYAAYGKGELKAVRKLCEQRKIPCDI